MTKRKMLALLDAYEADPDSPQWCDALCVVLDGLPGQPEGEYTVDEVRQLVLEAGDLP